MRPRPQQQVRRNDRIAFIDAQGTMVVSYSYDAFGQLASFSETFGGTTSPTWTNPYRYGGRDGVRYDGETGLYWLSVRAYDPGTRRFCLRRYQLERLR